VYRIKKQKSGQASPKGCKGIQRERDKNEPVSKSLKRPIFTWKGTRANVGRTLATFVEVFYGFLALFWLFHDCTSEQIMIVSPKPYSVHHS
jgi:hypothetical protein